MVKNIPTIERSTKIRFGRNVPDSDVQAENTIIFNASNTLVTTPNSGSIYMSPVRFRNDIVDPNIVLMMYNRATGELSESGESANALVGGQSFQATSDRGNTSSNTLQFTNFNTSLVTTGNVGIANTQPLHSLSVGSNLYVSDTGANVLVVAGGVSIDGNLVVSGGVTTISSQNLTVDDGIIELGRNNVSGDSTLDLGLIMSRPTSNITVGFLESSEEIVLAYTQSSADNATITPLTSQDINVHVYGRLYTEANVGVLNTDPMHTLDVGSNLYVDEFGSNILVVSGNTNVTGDLTVDTDTLYVDSVSDRVGIKTTNPQVELHVVGNAYVSSNLTVDGDLTIDTNTLHVNAATDKVGVKTTSPDAELHVVGNAYVSSNLTVDNDTFHVDAVNQRVGIETKNPDAKLHVVGNVYVSSNLTVDNDTFHVDAVNQKVGIETKNPDAKLHVVGNVYVSDDLTVATNTLHVEASTERIGIKTKTPDAELHIVGNVYVASDLTVDNDTFHVDAGDKSVGLGTVNPHANLHVVGNTYVSSDLTVDTNTLHVDAGDKSVGLGTVSPNANLHVVGNVYVSSDLTVDTDTLHVDAGGNKVGVKTKSPDAELHVVGNAYVSSDLTVDTDTFHVDAGGNKVGIKTKSPDAELHVVGNAYVSSDLTVDTNTLHVDAGDKSVGLGTANPNANLHVVGNVYVSSDLTVDTDTLHVDAATDSVGVGTVNPTSNFHVAGNAYVSSNTTTDGTLTLNHPTTAILTDLTSNVEVKLNQLANVSINTTDVDESLRSDHVLVYDGVNWVNEYPAHNYIRFYNDSGSTLYSGNCVYIVGHHNANLVEVGLASATSADTMPSIGIVYNTSVAQGDQGVAVAYGKVNQMDTSGFLEGDTLYVSNVNAGLLSNVKPYGVDLDLIQNIGVCTRSHPSSGTIFVTGVGRSNDIPNARIVLDEGDINYVYVNDQNNDLKKIEPSNLLTQLQTFEQVSAAGNVVSNIMSFTNSTTSIVTSSNAIVGGNISVADLTDPLKKYLPMVDSDGFFEKSPVYIEKSSGKYVISASQAEFLGNITLSGNTTIVSSTSLTISDRIFGVAANNSASQLDSGFMIEHQEGDPLEYANVALIYHADEHRFSLSYTQNTFTDNHILHLDDADHRMLIDLYGNVNVRHNLVVEETMNVVGTSLLSGDLTVGGASNLFVDVSTSNVGINEGTPLRNLDVNGDMRVQDTTDTASTSGGALVVLGGLGVASNIHSTNVYAASHVGVGTVTTTRPVHVMANGAGGVYINGDGNDARVTLEATGITADPVTSFTVNGGESFSVGIDNSINDTFNISNHASDVGTNARVKVTPAGITTLTNATNATSKTTGSLILGGGLGVAGDIHGRNVFIEDVVSNSVAVLDTTNATSKTTGAVRISGGLGVSEDIHGKNVFIEDVVSNSVAVLDTTNATSKTTGAVRISGGLGVSEDIHGKNVFIEDVVSNSVIILDTTTSDSTTTGALRVTGGASTQENLNVGGVTKVWDATDASSTTTGALQVLGGLGVVKSIHAADATFESVGVTDTTHAISRTTGAVTIAGGLGVSTNVHAANVYVTGGLITNTAGVTKKTYSYSGTLPAGTTDAQGTLDIVFSPDVFSAKITAHLVEDATEISVLTLDVGGGHKTGGTSPIIFKGPLTIFGGTNDNPWSSTVATSTTTTDVTVSIKPSQAIQSLITADYNIFVEYTSSASGGRLLQINDHQASPVTVSFGY
jgi:hypothetical protein